MLEIGQRIRLERKRMGINQGDFGALAGVTLQTQSRYEQGATELGVTYLKRIATHGVDILFIVTGKRTAGTLSPEQAALLEAFNTVALFDRLTILRIVATLAGQPLPPLPILNTEALAEVLAQFVRVTPTNDVDAFAQELATSLPTILRGVADAHEAPASDEADTPPASPPAADIDRPANRRARRN